VPLILGASLSSQLSSGSDDEKKSTNAETEDKLTPVVLAQHILSKSNLEQLFDGLTKRPMLVANGCDFLETVLDLLSRYMPVPICIPLTSKDNSSSSNPEEKNEPMQVKIKTSFQKSRNNTYLRLMMKEILYQ
jgi:hypothetical protein